MNCAMTWRWVSRQWIYPRYLRERKISHWFRVLPSARCRCKGVCLDTVRQGCARWLRVQRRCYGWSTDLYWWNPETCCRNDESHETTAFSLTADMYDDRKMMSSCCAIETKLRPWSNLSDIPSTANHRGSFSWFWSFRQLSIIKTITAYLLVNYWAKFFNHLSPFRIASDIICVLSFICREEELESTA